MNFPFLSNKQKNKAKEISSIELLQQQVNDLQENILGMTDKIAKLSRHQVKNSKNIEEKVDHFQTVIVRQTEHDKLLRENDQLEGRQSHLIETIMTMLDEIDHVSSGIRGEDQAWNDMYRQWSESLVTNLEKAGVFESDMLGKSFDPHLSESIKTVAKAELDVEPTVAYQVVAILKRGFVDAQGKLLRKAHVITVEEDLYEANRENEQG